MDGVTDAPNRTMHGLYGRPDVVITEFTNVEGLWRGGDRIFRDFLYTPAERPVVAQIFGCQPEYFYKAAQVVCELGFDGLDINMGCPAKTIATGISPRCRSNSNRWKPVVVASWSSATVVGSPI